MRYLTLLLLVLPLFGYSRIVHAAEIIEQVVAIVDEDVILLSDLRRTAMPFLQQALSGADSAKERKKRVYLLYRRLLDQLINEKLLQQAANQMKISVSKLEVDQAIDRVRQQNNLTKEQFWEAVQNQGFTPQQYREDIRKQLVQLKVTNQQVRSRANVSDEEVKQRYLENVRKARRLLRFHAAHIYFELSPSATATEVRDMFQLADNIAHNLTPDNFDSAVEKHGGGDLGWLSQGDLPESLEKALLSLEPKQISKPVRGPSGIHIFLLRERQRSSDALPSFEEARERIHQEMTEAAMVKQQKLFIEQLRKKTLIEVKLSD